MGEYADITATLTIPDATDDRLRDVCGAVGYPIAVADRPGMLEELGDCLLGWIADGCDCDAVVSDVDGTVTVNFEGNRMGAGFLGDLTSLAELGVTGAVDTNNYDGPARWLLDDGTVHAVEGTILYIHRTALTDHGRRYFGVPDPRPTQPDLIAIVDATTGTTVAWAQDEPTAITLVDVLRARPLT